MDGLIKSIVDELTIELQATDENFSPSLLETKVKSACREVRNARNYPSTYSKDKIASDMEQFYSNIRNISLYDYNMVGGEFQTNLSENSTSRAWVSRESLFNGIIPIAKV